MQQITKNSLANFYREFLNNYLTTAKMAEHYEMPEADCIYLIELGKKFHNEIAEDLKGRYRLSGTLN